MQSGCSRASRTGYCTASLEGGRTMPRADLSEFLVHWIRGESEVEAFATLRQIVQEQRLLGSSGAIRGGYRCVCFTEAPEATFHQMLGRYRPFGVRLSKRWLYAHGGRPVLYLSAAEYESLPEVLRWRFVRHEPDGTPPIDFTWEREWRVLTPELPLPAEEVTVVVPHENYAHELQAEHFYHEYVRVTFLKAEWGELAAFEEEQPFAYALSVVPQPV